MLTTQEPTVLACSHAVPFNNGNDDGNFKALQVLGTHTEALCCATGQ